MNENSDDYFTSGELSTLYNIPKQTLLYYDKIGLLKPEFIGDNGYQHYNIIQYLTLEIILSLRKLDIPIAQIKEYLHNKSTEAFLSLIEDRNNECLKYIAEQQKMQQSLSLIKESTLETQNIILDQVFLTHEVAVMLCVTPIEKGTAGKDIIKMTARHVYKVVSKNKFSKKNVGWIVDKDDFFTGNHNVSIAFYSIYDNSSRLPKSAVYVQQEGLYITIAFKGTYYEAAERIIARLQKFMKANQLEPVSNIFVIPLKNHWLTDNTDEYINKIILQVKNK
ncbi:MerR family transcriptional regulator [Pectinatus frisingensis]|uniref:MerR family transcriptional regulator n=1 Tax=Pectinatus frisingensis TaxID=865 RepID=UPI0018C4D97C|nr:MerR family transcriptional regulator [Pectinatus frisingensis]